MHKKTKEWRESMDPDKRFKPDEPAAARPD
jgi:hypothetical protein